MERTSLNVSLPESLKEYVESRMNEGGYSTPSEYVRALLREDRKKKAEQKGRRFKKKGHDALR
jgi:antitoxin ParD1/3/4